jgi:hypothetical protein
MEGMMNIKPGDLVELQSETRRYDTSLKVTVFKDGEVGMVTSVLAGAGEVVFIDVLLPQGILNTLESQVRRVQ